MNYFQNKYNQIKIYLQKKGFYDPRMLGVVLLAVIGLSVIWNGVKVIQKNYVLQQKVEIINEENRVLELENRNREIQIEYYKTPEFAELKARQINGKAAPGETVFIVTEQTAEQALKTPVATETVAKSEQKPIYQENFEAWIDFFFGDNS